LLASVLGVTDSIDVLKPDGARLNLKKRPGEIVRDLKRRVAAADGGASCCGSLELFVQDAPDALENDAVVGADVSVLFLLVSSGITVVHATLDACGSQAAIGTDAVLGGFKCTDGGKPGDVFRSSGFSTACCTARPVGAEDRLSYAEFVAEKTTDWSFVGVASARLLLLAPPPGMGSSGSSTYATPDFLGNFPGHCPGTWGWSQQRKIYRPPLPDITDAGTFATGDRVGILVDGEASTVQFVRNGAPVAVPFDVELPVLFCVGDGNCSGGTVFRAVASPDVEALQAALSDHGPLSSEAC